MSFGNALSLDVIFSFAATSSALSTLTPSAASAICIVDPRSYVIVDVIDQGYWGGGGRPQVAGLHLSAAEITLVRDSIPPDFPVADIRLRLALGAEIPDDVELHELPVIVLNRVPKLRDYRFLMTTDQIVIVDPGRRSIALVIDKA